MPKAPEEIELSKLDHRVAELAERYRPLAVQILKEAVRIPADDVEGPVDDGGDPRSGLSNHEGNDTTIDVGPDKAWVVSGPVKHPPMFGIGAGIEQNTHRIGECVDARELQHAIAVLARFPRAFVDLTTVGP